MACLPDHLWSEVGNGAAEGLRSFVPLKDALLGQTKICQLGMSFVVEHHIVRLQITVDNVPFVQILQSQQNLAQILSGPVLAEPALTLQDAPEISARAKV